MNIHEEMPEKVGKQENERPQTFFRFEDLRIYHKSLDYIIWVQEKTMLFPEEDKAQLALRFNETARNIALFISEGSSRNKSQFVHYLKSAKSSIRQCLVYTTLAFRQNLLTETAEQESRGQLMEMTKMIGALISSLQRSNSYNNQNRYNHNGNNIDPFNQIGNDYGNRDDY